jgi:hypothetical protein
LEIFEKLVQNLAAHEKAHLANFEDIAVWFFASDRNFEEKNRGGGVTGGLIFICYHFNPFRNSPSPIFSLSKFSYSVLSKI